MAFDTVALLLCRLGRKRKRAHLQSLHLPLDDQKVLRVDGFRNELAPVVVHVRACAVAPVDELNKNHGTKPFALFERQHVDRVELIEQTEL